MLNAASVRFLILNLILECTFCEFSGCRYGWSSGRTGMFVFHTIILDVSRVSTKISTIVSAHWNIPSFLPHDYAIRALQQLLPVWKVLFLCFDHTKLYTLCSNSYPRPHSCEGIILSWYSWSTLETYDAPYYVWQDTIMILGRISS